jgi:hypothetical protein
VSIMRENGAEVIQKGESWVEANEHALQLVHPRPLPRASFTITPSPDPIRSGHSQRRVHPPVRPRDAVGRPRIAHRRSGGGGRDA